VIHTRSVVLFVIFVTSSCLAQTHTEMNIPTPVAVQALVIARNGKVVASWGKDGKVRMWSLQTGQMLRSFEPNGQSAAQVCALSNLPCGLLLSQDGRWLFLGDSKGGVHVWDSNTGGVRFETALGRYISTAALSHDGAMLAVAATGEPAQVFDLQSKRLLFHLSSDFGGPMALAFSPDGSLIASADTDTAVRVFDVNTGKLRWRFDELTLEPFTVAFTVDGKFVLAGGPNKSFILLDASNGKAIRSYSKQKDIVRYLDVSPDGSAVAAVYFNESGSNIPAAVMVFDIRSTDVLSQWTPDVPIIGGGWISSGQLLVSTASEHALHIRSLP
jgi:DNA-binding beta-propeller fold protein YncE